MCSVSCLFGDATSVCTISSEIWIKCIYNNLQFYRYFGSLKGPIHTYNFVCRLSSVVCPLKFPIITIQPYIPLQIDPKYPNHCIYISQHMYTHCTVLQNFAIYLSQIQQSTQNLFNIPFITYIIIKIMIMIIIKMFWVLNTYFQKFL